MLEKEIISYAFAVKLCAVDVVDSAELVEEFDDHLFVRVPKSEWQDLTSTINEENDSE